MLLAAGMRYQWYACHRRLLETAIGSVSCGCKKMWGVEQEKQAYASAL